MLALSITHNFELNRLDEDRVLLEVHDIETNGYGDLYLDNDQLMQLHMLLAHQVGTDYLTPSPSEGS